MEIHFALVCFHDGVWIFRSTKPKKIQSEWNLSVSTLVLGMANSFHQKGAGNVEHIIIIYGTKAVLRVSLVQAFSPQFEPRSVAGA